MAARDVAVGQDGSIIISTESGFAWRHEKRITKKTGPDGAAGAREYKFVRVPGLARVVAVRSNAFGAYAAVTRGSEVARNGIDMPEKKIWEDVTRLIPRGIFDAVRGLKAVSGALMTVRIGKDDADIEGGERTLMERCRECFAAFEGKENVVWVGVEGCDVKFPIHKFLFVARSSVLAGMLTKSLQTRDQSIPDLLRMETGVDGRVNITFHEGIDFLAVFNLWVYIYTDKVYDIWLLLRLRNMSKGRRHFAIRVDVMKIASALDIPGLERAARMQVQPSGRLHLDMEKALSSDPRFFDDADIVIELDSGAEVQAHSALLIERSLFFKGMFHGMSRGQWLALRRQENGGVIRIDLRHIDPSIFKFVLRYIYVDADEELFDDVKCGTLDDLIDVIISVMAVANEFMIDRLAQVCQKILGGYVTTRNVCPLTNIIGPCFVRAFKTAALEYMCVNLETMLEGKFLDDLDEDLIQELDHVCHESQLACQPVARGRNSEEFLFGRFPELVPLIEEKKQRRVDAMRLKSRLHEDEERFRRSRIEKPDSAVPPSASKGDDVPTPTRPPALRSKQSVGDMMFEMEDEAFTLSTEAGTSLSQQQSISTPTSTLPWNFETPSRPRTALSAIMAEASALSTTPQPAQSAQALSATPLSSAKLSQKERKKLQQQQMREMMMEEEEKAQFRSSPWQRQQQQQQAASASASATKQSPAQGSPSAAASSPLDVKHPRHGQSRASSSKSGMTLRQTLAGGSKPQESPTSKSASQQQQQQQPASPSPLTARVVPQTQQNRGPVVNPNSPFARQPIHHAPTPPRPGPSALSNSLSSPHGPLPSPGTPTTQTPPPIRSIRYDTDPTPAELALRQNSLSSSTPTRSSLAAILLEQQIEKDVIREAATAKHNLEEIQLEQEFQQWWEQESQRVQQQAESEAARAAKRGSKGKSGKGRGGSHAADRGKGKGREEREGEGSHHSKNAGTGQKKKKGKQDAPSAPPAAAGNGSSHMQPQPQQQRQQDGPRHGDSRRGRPARGRGGNGAGGGHGARTNDRGHSQRPQGQVNTQ
ncbi:hypothetical protein KEM56_006593 [Ascosphaera pollenicola]|nr:hypothetical protein KEM56_006593 [Ascosphaera pollenicola]